MSLRPKEHDLRTLADDRPAPDTTTVASRRAGGRIAALDGLRAVAVAAVFVNHARPSALPGGWLGVDVFFVLSGFLITTLLLTEHRRSGRIDLRHFYSRRARRLLPALFLLLAAVAVVARMKSSLPGFGVLRGDGLSALAYIANWHFIAAGASYFNDFAPSPLRHLWSLAIEEQFYLVWPCVVIVLLRRGRERTVALVACALALVSALLMALRFGDGNGLSRAYFGTDTHAHPLLIGCTFAALLAAGRRLPAARALATLAAVGIGIAIFELDGTSRITYRGAIFVVAIFTAILISAMATDRGGPVAAVLGLWPLVALGRISYGVYLWHWPIIRVLTPERMHVRGWPLVGLQAIVTIAISAASWLLLERVVLNGRPAPRASWIALPAAALAVAIAVVAVAPSTTQPFAAARDLARSRAADRVPATVARDGVRRAGLIVGDSVAYTLFPGLEAYERPANLFMVTAAQTGCPLSAMAQARRDKNGQLIEIERPSYCDWPRTWPAVVDRTRPNLVVALFGLWDVYDIKVDGEWLSVGSEPWRNYMRRTLGEALDVLTARGGHVVVLTTPYTIGAPSDRVDALNKLFRDVASERPQQMRVVELQPLVDKLRPERWDGVHFTESGANALGRALAPELASFAQSWDGTRN